MTMLSTLCTKVDGKLKLFERGYFEREFAKFGDGEDLELLIERVGEKHTTAQRRFFHGPVLKAFMRLGMGKQEAKDMLALMFIPQEITLMDGSVWRVPGHTSALKKDEYTAFIEECIQCAAERGEVVEDADEWRRKQAASRKPKPSAVANHFVSFDEPMIGRRQRALCGELVYEYQSSNQPTCQSCLQAQKRVDEMEF